MRTAYGRITGHTGTPTAIRVPVVPVYATIRQEQPVPQHREPPERGRTIAILLIWAAVIAMFIAAGFLFRAVMLEPVHSGAVPGMYVSTIGYPPSP